MEAPFSSRIRQWFVACVLTGVVSITGFVIFQEWGNREWPEWGNEACLTGGKKTEAGNTEWPAGKIISKPSLTLLLWNVHNYGVAGENGLISGGNTPKRQEAVEAMVAVLVAQKADVLALVEVNSRPALEDLRRRLREKGMDYPHDEFLKREGQMRGMALLSRFPLSDKDSRAEVPLRDVEGRFPAGEGVSFMMRGILSATVQCPGGPLSVGVVHLKSRVGEQPGQEGLVRRAEADKVRDWVGEKRKASLATPLILCGDFNDTPDSPAIRSLLAAGDEGTVLKRLSAHDSRGEKWTQYYREAETYSLFDYVFYSVPDRKKQRLSALLVDDVHVEKASDHRPVLIKINKS